MSMQIGELNGHSVGRILKETVRRAMNTIREERRMFVATPKEGYSGTMDDVFTSADTKAQEIYVKAFSECFERCGVIGEENNLKISSRNGYYFTVDPLDGTKAYVRRQSHGVGTMVALVHNGVVVSAYVGDINANEVYGYRPGSSKVHRISNLDTSEDMQPGKKLQSRGEIQCLLREPVDKHDTFTEELVRCCKNHEVMGSSIGTWMARLWKEEVSMAVLDPGWETPWDSTPVVGISLKLGFVFLRKVAFGSNSRWETYTPGLVQEKVHRSHDTVIIHNQNLHLLLDF